MAMLKYLLIPIFSQILVPGAYGSEFPISMLLNNGKVLDKEKWSYVKVTENCFSGDHVNVGVKIPLSLNFSLTNDDISIFFANDKKEILQTSLEKTIRGKFFSVPYKLEKTMEGSQVHQNFDKDFLSLEADFPKAWLPRECTKISASIQSADGKIYNYYGIRNSDISISDLMVTEEYENYKCDSS